MKFKKDNYLLYLGTGIFSCTFIIYTIITSNNPNLIKSSNKLQNLDNVLLVIFSTLIFAPIIEEIIFRGLFTKKKIFLYTFYLGSIIMILLTKNYYLITIPLFYFFIEIKNLNKNELSYLLVSILFALIHYDYAEFTNVFSLIPVFFQLSISLILIWTTINFGLKYSILAHFFINFAIITPLVIVLQSPDTTIRNIKNEEIHFSWQKTSLIGNSKFSYSPKKVTAERLTVEQFFKLFPNKELQTIKVNDSIKFYRYNFSIEKFTNKNLDSNEVKDLLLKQKLIDN